MGGQPAPGPTDCAVCALSAASGAVLIALESSGLFACVWRLERDKNGELDATQKLRPVQLRSWLPERARYLRSWIMSWS